MNCAAILSKLVYYCKKPLYLLRYLLPFYLQHLLLLIGVIYDVLSPNQQLALHRLRKQTTF